MSDMPLPDWSVEASLDMMDRAGIARALLSVSSPGLHWGELKDAAKLARQVCCACGAQHECTCMHIPEACLLRIMTFYRSELRGSLWHCS